MKILIVTFVLLLATTVACAAPVSQAPPKMRPYSGIGILTLTVAVGADGAEPLQLYEEPAIGRIGKLDPARIPANEWIFGSIGTGLPLVVTARKGEWLRVAYDDAGREAWLNPGRQALFQPWALFFKGQVVRLLPGLQKGYYQLFQQKGKEVSATLTPKHLFRVVKMENDWAAVVNDQNSLGWLRWRDEDGRLLIGLGAVKP